MLSSSESLSSDDSDDDDDDDDEEEHVGNLNPTVALAFGRKMKQTEIENDDEEEMIARHFSIQTTDTPLA